MRIKAVFFDVGNTLLFPSAQLMLRSLHQLGVFPSPDLLGRIERETKLEFDAIQDGHRTVDQGFWNIYYSRLLNALAINNDSVLADLVACTRTSGNWQDVRPNTREVLLRLSGKYRLGVISNADGKIADILGRSGIADCFETITDSGIVGKEKPHPAIFAAAVNSLGVSPGESLYTGDVYSVDYIGAVRFGMHAVLFDVAGAYLSSGYPRVESLEELEMKLNSEFSA
jgi:HAD superfamily hydrolase (TIGR01509 family)